MTVTLSNGHSLASTKSKSYARISQIVDIPNLIQSQIQSFDWFKREGLSEVYKEISPILDYTGNKYELSFLEHSFRTRSTVLKSVSRRKSPSPHPSTSRPV